MVGDDLAGFVYGLLLLVLVGGAFAARRVPLGAGVKMAIAWVILFGVGFAAFALRDDFSALGHRLMREARPEQGITAGHTLRVPLAADGHYWVEGTIGNRRTRFLIDSGASTTALSDATASADGVTISDGMRTALMTANGPVEARRAKIAILHVGPITRTDFAAVTSPAFGESDVLGMNFLSSLSGWSVERGVLVLRD